MGPVSLLIRLEGYWNPATRTLLHLFQYMFSYKDRGMGPMMLTAQVVWLFSYLPANKLVCA